MTWRNAAASLSLHAAQRADELLAAGDMEGRRVWHWIVWTVDSFNKNTEPVHVRLTRVDDPTTYITVSINVLSDPRYFRRSDL